MIFIDLETTGLMQPTACELVLQPFMTEIYAVKLTDEYEMIAEIDTLVKPPVPIPEHITQITSITDEMVANKPPFAAIYQQMVELFLGEREVIGHNVSFDMGVVWAELARMGMEVKFPWPPVWTCTVEKSFSIEDRRQSLKNLFQICTGQPYGFGHHAHRAKDDVSALVTCHMWLKKNGYL